MPRFSAGSGTTSPPVQSLLRSAVATAGAVADLVLPGGCVACTAAGPPLCATCRRPLAGPARPRAPDPVPEGLPVVWAVAAYDGAPRAAIIAHKEQGRLALAAPLGDALAVALRAALPATLATERRRPRPLAVVPMPSRAAAVRARGHDPMLRVARRAVTVLARSSGHVELLPLLRARHRLADQAGLSSSDRAANLFGALMVPRRFRELLNSRVLLIVDDVVTTGASLAEAARALRGAEADVVGAAVIAATVRRAPPRRRQPGLFGHGHGG